MAVASKLRPLGHEDRLSLVEHLDELRSRLIICALTLLVAFGICLWQQSTLLDILNRPLQQTSTAGGKGPLEQNAVFQTKLRGALDQLSTSLQRVSRSESVGTAADRASLALSAQQLRSAVAALPTKPPERKPVTIGVSEPFTASLTIVFAASVLLAFPLILYQLYAFVLPAFTPRERGVAVPLMLMIPFLFISGAVFAYFAVLPPAIKFLQSYNSSSFDIFVQAKDLYRFEILTMVSLGALFQLPVGILALTRLGVITPRQLRKNRRYAIVVIAVIAMLLPGTDPVTMLIAMLPLLVLYEGSVLLASWVDRRAKRRAAAEESELGPEPS
jgi:sec-independent protein translocase protein TatC